MPATNSRVGRPSVFTPAQRRAVARGVARSNASTMVEALAAPADSDLAALRDGRVFKEPMSVSLGTVLNAAKAEGVVVRRGRPVSN